MFKAIFFGAVVFILTGLECATAGTSDPVPAITGSTTQPTIVASTDHSFTLKTGKYQVTYDATADKDGWILISREGLAGAFGTKLAQGEGLDVTAAGAGEGDIYKWKVGERKDSQIFRSLQCHETNDAIEITIHSERQWAKFESHLIAYKAHPGLLHWDVQATAQADRAFAGDSVPDVHFVAQVAPENNVLPATREVVRFAVQRGPGAPVVYFQDVAMQSLVFYFEDLTALNDLYRIAHSDQPFHYQAAGNPGAVKMGQAAAWFQAAAKPDGTPNLPQPFQPKVERYAEFGFHRPTGYFVSKGTSLCLGNTYLYLRPTEKTDNLTVCRNYVEMQAEIYAFLHKPPQVATDWQHDVVPQLIRDIMRPENTTHYLGKYEIPKAYVGFDKDDMQLWTLLNLLQPLERYVKKFPQDRGALELRDRLSAALPLFWDKNLRWFGNNRAPINPASYMTTVYILIPAHMLADLATDGDAMAKAMLLDAHDRYLAMGKACDYTFADVLLSDFSRQKVYYQFDATGEYVYLMMSYYNLSGGRDAEALAAAKAAASKLEDRCLDLGWQVNMTMAGAVGCEMLYQATHEAHYRELAYIPLANTLLQAWLWECDYGVGEHTTTFWGFCGCPAAPCTAEFESHRTRVAFRQYLDLVGKDIPPALGSMLEDGWKRGMTQSRSALPPLLVKDGAAPFMAVQGKSQTNCGEIRYDEMIPLEDVGPGWGTDLEWWQDNAKLGIVGQELYGAGGPIWYALWQDEVNPSLQPLLGPSK